MLMVLDNDIIFIMSHSIANNFIISFLRELSRKIRHLFEFPLLLGDVMTWKQLFLNYTGTLWGKVTG